MKMEITDIFNRSDDRAWLRVYVVLHGTMLSIYKVKTPSDVFGLSKDTERLLGGTPDYPAGTKQGALLESYTLQYAEVGVAADYRKADSPYSFLPLSVYLMLRRKGLVAPKPLYRRRRHVIRIRAESNQFLLSCQEVVTFLTWLEGLSSAIDLALPIDERAHPRYQTLPRRRRRRPLNDPAVLATQERIIRDHFPQLLENPPSSADTTAVAANDGGERILAATRLLMDPEIADTRPVSLASSNNNSQPSPESLALADIQPMPPTQNSDIENEDETIDIQEMREELANDPDQANSSNPQKDLSLRDGKWRPHSRWTEAHDLRYARRCMAILCGNSPRKSEVVVKDGKKWRIDWTLKKLQHLDAVPPYEGEERHDLSLTYRPKRGQPLF
ncbi:MAG: hypothetical protein M1829_006887 [Trizodia sp. TS-e1964]|nr:MAG: hypothetical protein M1829_006887 [Trizodia sp. TS-e1964]